MILLRKTLDQILRSLSDWAKVFDLNHSRTWAVWYKSQPTHTHTHTHTHTQAGPKPGLVLESEPKIESANTDSVPYHTRLLCFVVGTIGFATCSMKHEVEVIGQLLKLEAKHGISKCQHKNFIHTAISSQLPPSPPPPTTSRQTSGLEESMQISFSSKPLERSSIPPAKYSTRGRNLVSKFS